MNSAKISELIGLIYDAALDTGRWNDFISATKQEMGCVGGHIGLGYPPKNINLLGFDYDHARPSDLFAAMAGVGQEEIHFQRQHLSVEGRAMLSKDVASIEEITESRFYREVGHKFGLCYLAGAIVIRQPEMIAPFNFWRSVDQSPFDERHRDFLNLFTAHIRRSLFFMDLIQKKDELFDRLKNVFEFTPNPVAVLNNDGEVLFLNERAVNAFNNHDITISNDVIVWKDSNQNRKFQSYLEKVLSGEQSGEVFRVEGAEPDCILHVVCHATKRPSEARVEEDSRSTPALVMIFIDRDQPEPPSASLLRGAFGLTEAEAAMASALASGQSLPAYRDACGVSQNTARTHLKSIFAKTNTNSQVALMRVLSAFADVQ